MSIQLSFWLLVVFGLVVYVMIARANSTLPAERRKTSGETIGKKRVVGRERRATTRRPAAVRAETPANRRKTPAAGKSRRAAPGGPLSWLRFGRR
jgi:hypothetical protein